MAAADDKFLACLSDLTGPLTPHQTRIVVGALLDLLRKSTPKVRQEWRLFFSRYWRWRSLLDPFHPGFEETMQRVRQPPRRGRPSRSAALRVRYVKLRAAAELLRGRVPSLTDFRHALEKWERFGLIETSAPRRRLHWLYLHHEDPERLVLELLRVDTGKPVKDIRRLLSPRRAKRPPAR